MNYKSVVLALVVVATVTSSSAAVDFKVMQKDKVFSEKDVRIKTGDTVTFVNADTVTHNVYSMTKGCEFELKTQVPGKSDTVPFRSACVAEVQCAIHPKMKLQVHVQ